MLPLIIALLMVGFALRHVSLVEKRHKLVMKDYETRIQKLVNLVSEVDVENYRLRIAAGEMSPDAPIDPPGKRNIYRDLAISAETIPQQQERVRTHFRRQVEFSCTPFDDLDDLTVDDLEPHEEADLRDFSGIHDPKITLTMLDDDGGVIEVIPFPKPETEAETEA